MILAGAATPGRVHVGTACVGPLARGAGERASGAGSSSGGAAAIRGQPGRRRVRVQDSEQPARRSQPAVVVAVVAGVAIGTGGTRHPPPQLVCAIDHAPFSSLLDGLWASTVAAGLAPVGDCRGQLAPVGPTRRCVLHVALQPVMLCTRADYHKPPPWAFPTRLGARRAGRADGLVFRQPLRRHRRRASAPRRCPPPAAGAAPGSR